MKELVVISGKGGTGKTSLTASFAWLAQRNVVADCDVDAADLHLLAAPVPRSEESFSGGVIARIDPQKCTSCGLCRENCRYDAISEDFRVDDLSCEGCAVCRHLCPEGAVTLETAVNGRWFISDSRFGPMVHAELFPGAENSGKLVALVRNQAKVLAKAEDKDLIIVDGAPGVGCPVISSVTGADHVVVVTEPSLSGLHDMERAVQLVRGFGIAPSVILNKADINTDVARILREKCSAADVPIVGEIPYDPAFTKAMIQGKCVVENESPALSKHVRETWERLYEALTA